MINLSISDPNFWGTLRRALRDSGRIVACRDGDIRYAALSAERTMHIIHRTAEEFFADTVARESMRHGHKVVINGNFYGLTSYMDVMLGHDPVPAAETLPEGHIVIGGSVVGGTNEPLLFYIAHDSSKCGQEAYTFGQGNPPASSTTTALGGLGPVILGRLKYGNGNRYGPGVPAGAPSTGEPSARHRPYLTQRNDLRYREQAARGNLGKGMIALCRSQQVLLVLGVPHDAPRGISHDALRDMLYNVDVSDCVFVDGSDSVLLMINNRWYIQQGENKDETTTVALAFK